MRPPPPLRGSRRLLRLIGPLAIGVVLASGCQQATPTGSAAASSLCASCHLSEFEATSHPPHAGVRPTTCGVCHSTDSWHPFRLKHAWLLDGAHAKATCFACHSGNVPQFEGTSKACLSCHQAAKDKANASVTHHTSFPIECEKCHSTSAWKPTLPHQSPPQPSALPVAPQASVPPSTRHAAAAPAAGSPRKTPSAPPKPVTISPTPVVNRSAPDVVSGASPTRRK